MMRPSICGPTGTVIGRPVSVTSWPRTKPSVAPEQGIVHVVGPEQGFSLPGTTIVCGDSHTACHGGIGALAFGIGTSEVEHVLATQTLLLQPAKTMEVRVEGAEIGRAHV